MKDPKRFHFDPRFLLRKLIEIYLNFSGNEKFVHEVVNDGRSFGIGLFRRAIHILRKNVMLPEVFILFYSFHPLPSICCNDSSDIVQDTISAFELFVDKIEAESSRLDRDQEELGDIPEEYLGKETYHSTLTRS